MLKKIVLVLVALLAAFAIYVALQPSDYRVERTVTVDTPASEVFANVNDFHKWESWSPWAKIDPNAKIAFEGPEAGEGTVMTWDGNDDVGAGKMTLIESKPDEAVKIKVEFTRPFEGSTNSDFSFAPNGEQTDVTWTLSGMHNFVEKAFCLVMNGLDMMGSDLEKGLSQLKSASERS